MASAALMTSLGIWSCQWRELRPINFGGKGEAKRPTPDIGPVASDEHEGAGYGHGWGRGRGRARDGAGEYEMVGLNEGAETNV